MEDKIIERLAAYENAIGQFEDVIAADAAVIRKEYGIISAQEMKAQFAKLEESDQLLNIAIVGRVRAGKSSLLNSIFFDGKPVLPKAAMPMTASLTVMTYGDSFSATVEYFSADDIARIKKEHAEFKRERDRVYEEKKSAEEERARNFGESPDKDKIDRATNAVMKGNHKFASWDQYERMMKGAAPTVESQNLAASSLEEFLGKLNEYVGSSGAKTPYTKSVEMRLPVENLRGIRIVDTPGINDPVISREARTNEYLKECDVAFIVSPAGQFISKEDTNLMDRLTKKESVRELYLVASQADTQLHGLEVLERSGGNLGAAIKMNSAVLTEIALGNLRDLKKNNPEIGDQFDQLINDGEGRVMITSAMCHAMYLQFDDRNSWDADMNHAWGLLGGSYPADFTNDAGGKESLKQLSGVENVREKINFARSQKDKIIACKKDEYAKYQLDKIDYFSQKLAQKVKEKIDWLNSIENKEATLDRLAKCKAALEGVSAS
ncbi:MAG: dynamin family protein [Spirochaetes bacterium]|nr:dynamin family protein [Spirochaetota bacterium]